MKTEQVNDKPCTYILLMAQNDDIVTANDNREEKNGWNTEEFLICSLFAPHTHIVSPSFLYLRFRFLEHLAGNHLRGSMHACLRSFVRLSEYE